MNLKPYTFYILVALAVLLYFGGRYLYFMPKYSDGEQAPDFTHELLNGTAFSLSDLRGSYVLLDFWGSWCGPCRSESPKIVDLFNRYENRSVNGATGFVVVNIGIEMNEQSWKRAIVRDGLDWPYHIGQFDRFASPIAKAYGVRELPTKFLIDPEGQILSVNPSIHEIEEVLSGSN